MLQSVYEAVLVLNQGAMTYGGREFKAPRILNSTLDCGKSQLHVPATLSAWKESPVLTE
jgi:hypothetical protein